MEKWENREGESREEKSRKKQEGRRHRRVRFLFLFFCLVYCWSGGNGSIVCMEVQAEEEADVDYSKVENEAQDKIFAEFDFDGLDESLREMFPGERISFREIVTALIQGDGKEAGGMALRFLSELFFYELENGRKNLAYILIITLIAAIFTNFSNAFQNRQVSEISFYILYMLLITLCLQTFRMTMAGVENDLERLLDFMRVLSPSYFLAVAIAAGSSSSLVFYNVVLFLIYIVETLILHVLLPLIQIFMVVQVMNYLSGEDYLSQLAELLKKLVTWGLKTLVACVIGINVVQGMLAPAIDTLKRSALTRTAEAIPALGNIIGGVADVVLGSAVLIKNGIGMAGVLILAVLCCIPLMKIALMMVLYKLAAALVQPVSDKRITGCISSVSEGYELLIRAVFSSGMLFLLTIAVVTASTT